MEPMEHVEREFDVLLHRLLHRNPEHVQALLRQVMAERRGEGAAAAGGPPGGGPPAASALGRRLYRNLGLSQMSGRRAFLNGSHTAEDMTVFLTILYNSHIPMIFYYMSSFNAMNLGFTGFFDASLRRRTQAASRNAGGHRSSGL